MPGVENKIWGTKYDEPYSTTCYKRVCVWNACTDVPYPCFGMSRKYYDIYIGYNYPSVSEAQQLTIHSCAKVAMDLAASIIGSAVASCAVINAACIGVVAESIAKANKLARETFFACLKTANLPEEIRSKCEIGVYDRQGTA
ncbi:hypothetical protein [Bacillus pseudomycoides]|uniref:hypothetical protein n=1 Tax=Bacillus pseudomycoides TaxID=64104 RepID=UPI00030AFC2A|nr:hypothetical protein [Bacillus pseudomycoides]PGC32147.1 hypothetical protein COM18_27465 [Bacillus pseudomycoides]